MITSVGDINRKMAWHFQLYCTLVCDPATSSSMSVLDNDTFHKQWVEQMLLIFLLIW